MSRRIARQVCHGVYEGVMEDSNSISKDSSLKFSERDTAIDDWLESIQVSPDGTLQSDEDATHDDDASWNATDDNDEELTSGHKALLDSEAYRWLKSVMQRSSRLNGIDPHRMSSHRKIIARQIQAITTQDSLRKRAPRLITSKIQPPIYMARFDLPWNLLTFLREEYESEDLRGGVGQLITLTGDGRSVQAETCRGYLQQVWPTTGTEFMDFVEDLVTRAGQSCKRKLLARTIQITHVRLIPPKIFSQIGPKSQLD